MGKTQGTLLEQTYIDNLVYRLGNTYVKYIRNLEYGVEYGNIAGEIDLLALKPNGHMDIFEVKASRRHLHTGIEQIARAKQYLPNIDNGYLYVGLEDVIMDTDYQIVYRRK